MTPVQERLLSLIDEISEICEKENLSYIISNESARYFLDHKGFEDEQCYVKLMMPLNDIEKLNAYITKNLSDKREIEGWQSNAKLQHFKFRYVDKTTLLFDGGSGEDHISHGINLTLYPIREFECSNQARGCERYLQLHNYGQAKQAKWIVFCKFLTRITTIRRFKSHIMSKVKIENSNYIHSGLSASKKMSIDEMAKFIVKENLAATKPYTSNRFIPEEKLEKDPTLRENCYAYMDERCNVIKFPIDLFKNTKNVEFEGRSYKVYADEELYFSQLYGKNWETRSREPIGGTDRVAVLWDLDIPYAEFVDYVKDDPVSLTELVDVKRNYNRWMGRVYNPAVNRTQKMFDNVRRSVDRIDIWYNLRNKRDDLKKAYESGDLKKLRSIMKPYLTASDKYYAEKIGFYIDDELFKYATALWNEEGRQGKIDAEGNELSYADLVYRIVPDIYKEETPDMYFAKRGTKII